MCRRQKSPHALAIFTHRSLAFNLLIRLDLAHEERPTVRNHSTAQTTRTGRDGVRLETFQPSNTAETPSNAAIGSTEVSSGQKSDMKVLKAKLSKN